MAALSTLHSSGPGRGRNLGARAGHGMVFPCFLAFDEMFFLTYLLYLTLYPNIMNSFCFFPHLQFLLRWSKLLHMNTTHTGQYPRFGEKRKD